MINKFTFGVLAYNQEKEVVQTLNSIKYQIINYGKKISCNLVITDDYSTDLTMDAIKTWINNNANYFKKIITRFNTDNKGTVDNYNFILGQICDEPFKIIAGDDLISQNNIFETFDYVGEHTLYNGFRMFFNENGVYIREQYLHLHFWMMKKKYSREKILRLFRMGHIISTPQTLYRKVLYTDSEAQKFNCRFRIFEDNPTWYSMIKNVKDIEVSFNIKPVTLYRISDKGISHGTKIKPVFKDELYKLYKTYIEDGNMLEKIYFKSAVSGLPKLLNLSVYVTRLFYIRCAVFSVLHRSQFNEFKNAELKELEKQKRYYKAICNM